MLCTVYLLTCVMRCSGPDYWRKRMPTDKDKRRVPILNTYIDALTMDETISEVEKIIARGVPTQHVVINANKVNLMNELGKISRVIDREYPEAEKETLLVLDGTAGQNALFQAREFANTVHVDGIILTKLDGTAKGGFVLAIKEELGIPVKYIGVGEGIDDLQRFDPKDFVDSLID